ncbi:transcriptional protein SWT1 isoform X1 [Colletes gigas]|uniref:transcriptional protein SWT1 isoform X1 n=1 Tax=Colletes gigas TaxID=935657 RepID=UPI001C9B4668|nr:transcriptional protein SWT1 isoform X1 [Colletes gigas]
MIKRKLPKNWRVLNSKTHPDRVYYFNMRTKQSSWEEPTEDHPEQVTEKSPEDVGKRKNSLQDADVSKCQSKLPERKTNERKKLVAKRSLRQTQEKTNEEKETPQMRAIREKMLKKKEKNNISKIQSQKYSNIRSPSNSNKTTSLSSNSESNTDVKTTYTPQMQMVLKKMQDKNSNSTTNIKMTETSENNNNNNVKSKRLRNRSAYTQRNTNSDISPTLESSNKNKEQQNLDTSDKSAIKKKKDDNNLAEVISKKRTSKSFKKNLGKERMEELRRSLTLEVSRSDSSECDSSLQNLVSVKKYVKKLPNIHKNAEVRLTRLKDRYSTNKIINKSSCNNQPEETEKLPIQSVTTIDDLVKQANEESFCEEMDWEPMPDEKITFEVQAVRSQLCTQNNADISCSITNNVLNCSPLLKQQGKRQLYIVVDTNVFLSNIEAVESAKDVTFKNYDQPVIVIPWTVIRELDYIKGGNGKTKSPTLSMKARNAINYIHKLFSSKDPRIIGQRREDVARNKEKFIIDCPDDEILQTCLQIRDLEKSVVLLSYDINLCNKAMVYDIVTLGRNDPLEKVDYLNMSKHSNNLSRNDNEQDKESSLNPVSILNQELRISNKICDDAKNIMKDFLTVIVSKEMYELYGDTWQKYVIIKPPWTVITVLQCALKHWIAAVSESFLRKAEDILRELLQIFKDVSGERTLKDVKYILDRCSDLSQMVNIDKYPNLMQQVYQKIDELKQKCRDLESQLLEEKLHDAIGIENNIEERERRAQKAFQYFEAAYIFARDMCGLSAEAVGMPCGFHYIIPNPLPTPDYLKQIQPELAANVNRLLHTLSAAMEQVHDSRIDYRMINNLHQTLITFLPETKQVSKKFDNDDLTPLDVFCCMKQKEEVLKTGLRQLQELSTHFCRLTTYRSN